MERIEKIQQSYNDIKNQVGYLYQDCSQLMEFIEGIENYQWINFNGKQVKEIEKYKSEISKIKNEMCEIAQLTSS